MEQRNALVGGVTNCHDEPCRLWHQAVNPAACWSRRGLRLNHASKLPFPVRMPSSRQLPLSLKLQAASERCVKQQVVVKEHKQINSSFGLGSDKAKCRPSGCSHPFHAMCTHLGHTSPCTGKSAVSKPTGSATNSSPIQSSVFSCPLQHCNTATLEKAMASSSRNGETTFTPSRHWKLVRTQAIPTKNNFCLSRLRKVWLEIPNESM